MATKKEKANPLGWRSVNLDLKTYLLERFYMTGCCVIGCFLSIYYLNNYRNDLLSYHKELLSILSYIYLIKNLLLFFYIQKNRPWSKEELYAAPIFIPLLFIVPVYIAHKKPFASNIFGVLYLLGFVLSVLSELQRKWFKDNIKNKGKLYTERLFSISRHPNYFAELLLFSGWYGLSYNIKGLIAPLLMLGNFHYAIIPEIEGYLKQKYSKQWQEYENNVKSLIPFIV